MEHILIVGAMQRVTTLWTDYGLSLFDLQMSMKAESILDYILRVQ